MCTRSTTLNVQSTVTLVRGACACTLRISTAATMTPLPPANCTANSRIHLASTGSSFSRLSPSVTNAAVFSESVRSPPHSQQCPSMALCSAHPRWTALKQQRVHKVSRRSRKMHTCHVHFEWNSAPPPGAPTNLQACLRRLAKQLSPHLPELPTRRK